jgi:hypothetical protein
MRPGRFCAQVKANPRDRNSPGQPLITFKAAVSTAIAALLILDVAAEE